MNGMALCAGDGGLELGIGLAVPEYRCVVAVEGEAHAAATLVRRMAQAALDDCPLWDDARTFDGRPWRPVVDIVSGGYPCQGESVAGKRGGKHDPRWLWPSFRRIVGEVEPEWCFFENVPGHLSLGFEAVADDLRAMGYAVAAGLFTAEEVGATHRRERVFILAHADRFGSEPLRHGARELQRREEGRGEATERRGVDVADADLGVGHVPGVAPSTRFDPQPCPGPETDNVGEPGGCRPALADPRRPRPSGRPMRGGDGREECTAAQRVRGDAVVDPASLGRREGRAEPELRGGGRAVADPGRGLPAFPPGPADLESWRIVLKSRPDVEPARRKPGRRILKQAQRYLEARTEEEKASFKPSVRRVAHGLADRVDRLRGCGNGVVPLEAAYAFRILRLAIED